MEIDDKMRAAFEAYASSDGEYPRAIGKRPDGEYLLAATAHAWAVWQDAWAAARVPRGATPLDTRLPWGVPPVGEKVPDFPAPQLSPITPDGWRLVPLAPNEDQWGGLARIIMLWLDMTHRPTGNSLKEYLRACGQACPDWLQTELDLFGDRVASKGDRVYWIYRAMVEAAPPAPGGTNEQ